MEDPVEQQHTTAQSSSETSYSAADTAPVSLKVWTGPRKLFQFLLVVAVFSVGPLICLPIFGYFESSVDQEFKTMKTTGPQLPLPDPDSPEEQALANLLKSAAKNKIQQYATVDDFCSASRSALGDSPVADVCTRKAIVDNGKASAGLALLIAPTIPALLALWTIVLRLQRKNENAISRARIWLTKKTTTWIIGLTGIPTAAAVAYTAAASDVPGVISAIVGLIVGGILFVPQAIATEIYTNRVLTLKFEIQYPELVKAASPD